MRSPSLQRRLETVKTIAVGTVREWWQDDALQWGAALSFYSALALAPMLMLVLLVTAPFLGRETVREEVLDQLATLIGQQGAQAVAAVLESAERPELGSLPAVLGLVTVLVGASGVFAQLQRALNHVWEVKPNPSTPWLRIVKVRLRAFGMILVIGFLLLVSTVLSAVIAGVTRYAQELMPIGLDLAYPLDVGLSLAVFSVLFGLIFKVLPDVEIGWRDVAIGAVATAVLFVVGKSLIGLYLGHSSVGSAYGAAGSLVVFLVWIYYSSQALFLGAEFTQVWAHHCGKGIRPNEHAVWEDGREDEDLGETRRPRRQRSAGDPAPHGE